MAVNQMVGKQSIAFQEAPHIISSASVVGPKEGEGPLKEAFDLIGGGVWRRYLGKSGEHDAEGSAADRGRKGRTFP